MANKDFMDPELTEEEKEDMIIKNEEDYLEGLLAAADDAASPTIPPSMTPTSAWSGTGSASLLFCPKCTSRGT